MFDPMSKEDPFPLIPPISEPKSRYLQALPTVGKDMSVNIVGSRRAATGSPVTTAPVLAAQKVAFALSASGSAVASPVAQPGSSKVKPATRTSAHLPPRRVAVEGFTTADIPTLITAAAWLSYRTRWTTLNGRQIAFNLGPAIAVVDTILQRLSIPTRPCDNITVEYIDIEGRLIFKNATIPPAHPPSEYTHSEMLWTAITRLGHIIVEAKIPDHIAAVVSVADYPPVPAVPAQFGLEEKLLPGIDGLPLHCPRPTHMPGTRDIPLLQRRGTIVLTPILPRADTLASAPASTLLDSRAPTSPQFAPSTAQASPCDATRGIPLQRVLGRRSMPPARERRTPGGPRPAPGRCYQAHPVEVDAKLESFAGEGNAPSSSSHSSSDSSEHTSDGGHSYSTAATSEDERSPLMPPFRLDSDSMRSLLSKGDDGQANMSLAPVKIWKYKSYCRNKPDEDEFFAITR